MCSAVNLFPYAEKGHIPIPPTIPKLRTKTFPEHAQEEKANHPEMIFPLNKVLTSSSDELLQSTRASEQCDKYKNQT